MACFKETHDILGSKEYIGICIHNFFLNSSIVEANM